MGIRQDLLFFMFFGEKMDRIEENNQEEIIMMCVRKAYRDFCRTIEYGVLENDKKELLKNSICDLIVDQIKALSEEMSFDTWHNELCTEMIHMAKNFGDGILHYGQTQKWINMSLKYLRIMGKSFDKYKCEMHIPVDNYIIEAVNAPNENIFDGMEVKGLGLEKLNLGKSWSRCDDYGLYMNFQKRVREACDNNQIEWEEQAWMAIALKHSVELDR